MNNMPSVGQMLKLIALLILALIALKIALAIVAALLPLLVIALIIGGGVYLYNNLNSGKSVA
jgi:hypothetical protein